MDALRKAEMNPVDAILCEDCIPGLAKLPEKYVDLVFADPPYNLQLQQELRRPDLSVVDAVKDKWDQFSSFGDYDKFTEEWLRACRRVMKDDATIWVIGSYHNIFRVGKIMMDIGFWILNDVVWFKTNPMPNFRGTRFQSATETLIWAKKSYNQKKYHFNYHAMKRLNDDKQMQNVWHVPLCTGEERIRVNGRKAHSTQKPEQLLYRVIASSSDPGDIVLDPFMGSGTTAAVAKKLARRFIGFERAPEYVEIASRRLDQISPTLFHQDVLFTESKRTQPKVKFSWIVEAGMLTPGTSLFSRNRNHKATIMADSYLRTEQGCASIHKAGALVQKVPACNGWEFWHYENETGALAPIDHLRDQFLRVMSKMGEPDVGENQDINQANDPTGDSIFGLFQRNSPKLRNS